MNRAGTSRWAIVAAAVAAVAVGAASYRWHVASRADQADAASELFFAQRLRDGTNDERAMAALRGKPVVINFWATWCGPCVEEIPMFSKVHGEASDRVAFVGLGIDSPGNVIGFNERFKPSYPLLMAGASGTDLARAFGDEQGALPFTVLLGADGRVRATRLGRLDERTLRAWLDGRVDGR